MKSQLISAKEPERNARVKKYIFKVVDRGTGASTFYNIDFPGKESPHFVLYASFFYFLKLHSFKYFIENILFWN